MKNIWLLEKEWLGKVVKVKKGHYKGLMGSVTGIFGRPSYLLALECGPDDERTLIAVDSQSVEQVIG